ncbi:MAG: T9SS type A sorting domain-containing protein [Flavobacteriia bacterium]|nr:T9SS type A sorting domain-containing protein [Flavobacteriia bacterium]
MQWYSCNWNLCPGTYLLNYSNTNGTTSSFTFIISQSSTTNPCSNSTLTGTVSAVPSSNNLNCNGGLTVAVTGGVSPYTYNWTNTNGASSTAASLYYVCPGIYSVTIVDANGCTTIASGTVQNTDTTGTGGGTTYPCNDSTFNISLTQSTNIVTNCNGMLYAIVSGSFGPYTYAWSNGATTASIGNLCPGTYILYVSNSNGCVQSATATLVGDTTNPCANSGLGGSLTATNSTSYPNCNGTLTANIYGGTAPYNLNWNLNNGTVTNTTTISNLCPGYYTLYFTDANGCSSTLTGFVYGDSTNNPNPCANANLYASLTATNVTASSPNFCDGTVSATIYGGIAPYYYSWSNGSNDSMLTNVCSDIYSLTVVDANGCASIASVYVGYTYDSTFNMNGYVIPTGVSADGLCDGSASVIIYGGTSPYTYLYSDGSTSSTAINLCAGYQDVVVTDANGQSINLSFVISSLVNVINNPNLPDSTVIDSVYTNAITDCVINYSSIDSALITGVNFNTGNLIDVTWTVYYNSDSSVNITTTYTMLDSTAGVYTFVLQIYCPNKSIGNYLVATDQYYINKSAATITEIKSTSDLVVFPNPFNDFIEMSLEKEISSTIVITDVLGKQVLTHSTNSKNIRLDVSNLVKGQYFITVSNANGVFTNKIIK